MPNSLGWKCHLGFSLNNNNDDDDKDCNNDEVVRDNLQSSGIEYDDVSHAGTMLFSFREVKYDPMRVYVYKVLCNVFNNDDTRGKWIPYSECPYEQMWADDPIWLPKILEDSANRLYFEGHFVFSHGPRASSSINHLNFQCFPGL